MPTLHINFSNVFMLKKRNPPSNDMTSWHFNFGQVEFAYWHDPDNLISVPRIAPHPHGLSLGLSAVAMLQMLCKDSAALGSEQLSPPRPRAQAFTGAGARAGSEAECGVTQSSADAQPGSIQPGWARRSISCSDTASSIIIIITVIIITRNISLFAQSLWWDSVLSALLPFPRASVTHVTTHSDNRQWHPGAGHTGHLMSGSDWWMLQSTRPRCRPDCPPPGQPRSCWAPASPLIRRSRPAPPHPQPSPQLNRYGHNSFLF